MSDRFLATSVVIAASEAPEAEALAEIALPPFGLPIAQ
jgi:hypothetical protein